MKQSLQLFAILMALFYSPLAHAVVDPYEVMEITPAEGNVTSLQHFTITFGGLPVVVTNGAVPTLEKGGGATYEGTMRVADDGITVLVDFDVCCTASGQYFLNLPENSLTVNGQRLLPLTLRFNIAGTMDSFYEQITIDPAEGEVESLQNFIISLPQYVGEIEYGSMATLTNTTTGTAYQADGTVSISDVTSLIDILLGGTTSPAAADVNVDGTVSISDVTSLIDMLLGNH